MTTVTPDTPWRVIGHATPAALTAEFGRLGPSPLVAVAAEIASAAAPHGRLLAAISFVEQKHATWPSVIPADAHNFLSLSSGWADGAHTWHRFAGYAACAASWRERLLDSGGPYAATITLRDLIAVYAPASENDTDRYIREVVAVVNRLPELGPSPPAGAALWFGRVAAPPVVHRDLPPDLNTAWDDLGPRRPRFVVLHRMEGTLAGTDTYFRTDARRIARTDYGIDHGSGEIWRWTDPLGPNSPHASGPWTAPPGDGIALVDHLGEAAINRDGVSIEIAGFAADPVSDIAFERLARLVAFWADWAGVPHGDWPTNPATGLPFVYWHCEFNGAKSCPGDVVKRLTSRLIRRVGELLRVAQSGQTDPVPLPTGPADDPDVDPVAGLDLPAGIEVAELVPWFGGVPAPDGAGRRFAFDPAGPLSRAWLERGRASGVWPALESVERDAGTLTFRFADGWTVRAENGRLTEIRAAA
jgi:hypothetical protein